MRKVRNIILLSVAAVSVFFAGIAIACDGNYVEDWNTLYCVTMDEWTSTNACKNLDTTGTRCWNCSQEIFFCPEASFGDEFKPGPVFNCHTPGAACQ